MAQATAPRPAEDGFTLLELVVAMLVISLAVAGLIGVLNTSFTSTAVDIHRTDATAIAAQALSQLEAGSFVNPTVVTRANQQYTVTGTPALATPSQGPSDPKYLAYAVTVAWQDRAGAHTVKQSTAAYPASATSTTAACGVISGVGVPTVTAPATGDPSLDVSWPDPGGVDDWQVLVSGGGAFTVAATVPPLSGQTQTVEVGGLAPATAYQVEVAAVTGCGPQVFGPTAPVTTAASTATACAPSLTLGPSVVTRDPAALTVPAVSVVVTTPGPCPSGLWVGVLTTNDPNWPASPDLTAPLTQTGPGTYTGTVADPIQEWDLGVHTVQVFESATPITPLPPSPAATAVLCVTTGASTC